LPIADYLLKPAVAYNRVIIAVIYGIYIWRLCMFIYIVYIYIVYYYYIYYIYYISDVAISGLILK
jgi:hypothetical protein